MVIFGFSARYLNKPNPALRYANRAVYPFYILHQTITIIVAFYIRDLSWNIGLKFIILSAATFAGSWFIYEFLIRRINYIGVLFGLKSE
jgi:peptidoglycan/LPS O-acetylase OafA/YrhL